MEQEKIPWVELLNLESKIQIDYERSKIEGVTAIIKNVKNRNLQNAWVSGKFLRYPGIWEISQILWHLRNFQNLKNTTLKQVTGI